MVRTRGNTSTDAPENPPQPDMMTLMMALQRQLQEQQQEMARFREQLERMNQAPQVQAAPQPVPPVVPPVPNANVQPEAQPAVPPPAEIPVAPAAMPANPPAVREDMLYERFRRMKAPEFEGPTDPIAADNWLIDIQVILNFMRLTEQEKVLCASFALKKDARHWWTTVEARRDVMAMTW